jgi:hypothetical protein
MLKLTALWHRMKTPSYIGRVKRLLDTAQHELLDYEEQAENAKAAISATKLRINRLKKELKSHGHHHPSA